MVGQEPDCYGTHGLNTYPEIMTFATSCIKCGHSSRLVK
jgi:hypothetical protein